MMPFTMGRFGTSFSREVCKALGLDPNKVTKIIIDIEPTDVDVTVGRLVSDDERQRLVEVFDHYKLVPEDEMVLGPPEVFRGKDKE